MDSPNEVHVSIGGPRGAQRAAATGDLVVSSTAGGKVSLTVRESDGTVADIYLSVERAAVLADELTEGVIALRHFAATGSAVGGWTPPTHGIPVSADPGSLAGRILGLDDD